MALLDAVVKDVSIPRIADVAPLDLAAALEGSGLSEQARRLDPRPETPEIEPFTWGAVGPQLCALIVAMYGVCKVACAPTLALLGPGPWHDSKAVVLAAIRAQLKAWDNDYGWDFPHMSETTEDAMYDWLAGRVVDELRHMDPDV